MAYTKGEKHVRFLATGPTECGRAAVQHPDYSDIYPGIHKLVSRYVFYPHADTPRVTGDQMPRRLDPQRAIVLVDGIERMVPWNCVEEV